MYSLIQLILISAALSLLLTPICRNLCRRFGILDYPDDKRKVHQLALPRVGGVAIVLSYAGALALVLTINSKAAISVRDSVPLLWKLIPAAAVAFATGLVDDLVGLKPWQKLAGQLAAAALACVAGAQIATVLGKPIGMWWSAPLTVVWLLACMNAFNLIDGLDGLAAGIGLFATVTTLIAALVQKNIALATATVPLAGALLGFLRYNFNPASIFLGDCGSLFIGFVLGCCSVLWTQKSAALLGMAAPVMALAVPLADTALAILRRFLRGQPIFAADRGHIHHKLLDRGLTPRRVALIMYGICAVAAALSLLQSLAYAQLGGMVIVLFCGGAVVGVQRLRYVEFGAAADVLRSVGFRQAVSARIELSAFERELTSAETAQACWTLVRANYRQFGFAAVEMRLGGECYTDPNQPELRDCYTVTVPLRPPDRLKLTRRPGSPAESQVAMLFVDVVGSVLRLRRRPTCTPPEADVTAPAETGSQGFRTWTAGA